MPFLAFFSKRLYHDVGCNWNGVNLAYLFLLVAICCIPPTLTMRSQMVQSMGNGQLDLINQIPEIHIVDGHVSVAQHQPIYITRKDGSPAMIIDTTGSMNYIDDERVFALLTETALIVRRGATTFNTFNLSNITDIHINKHIANSWLLAAKEAIAPLTYGIFLMLSYVFAVMAMILAAVIGLILSVAMHGTLNFPSALRVATVAATPSIIFMTISSALGIAISGGIYLAVSLIYLVVGINACIKPTEANEVKIDLKSLLHEEAAPIQKAA